MTPQPPTLKISEIFASAQGEGLRQGEPTIFVRLAGCNLSCDFCDTKYALANGVLMSIDKIVEKIRSLGRNWPTRWICLTGGEPLLQDITGLARKLKAEGFFIQVETNGTLYRHIDVDWYSVSPKPPKYRFRSEYLEKAKEIKLVITKDLEWSTISILRNKFPKKAPLILQPQSHRKWSLQKAWRLYREAAKKGLVNVRLSVQLHKIYKIP